MAVCRVLTPRHSYGRGAKFVDQPFARLRGKVPLMCELGVAKSDFATPINSQRLLANLTALTFCKRYPKLGVVHSGAQPLPYTDAQTDLLRELVPRNPNVIHFATKRVGRVRSHHGRRGGAYTNVQ